jgi:membrane protease YdiL (CAAX protease family)
VPGDFWTETQKMATAGLMVAAVAVPVALVARALRPRGEPLLPRWKPWRVPWGGFEVALAFLAMMAAPATADLVLSKAGFYQAVYGATFPAPGADGLSPEQSQEASNRRTLWTGLLSLPPLLVVLWLAARVLYPKWKPALTGRGSVAGMVWLAVLAWFAVTPPVLAFNAGVNEVLKRLGGAPEEHALARAAGRPLLDQVLLLLGTSVAAPVVEELFFRGILLPWCIGRSKWLAQGVDPATAARPWFVMLAAGLLASTPILGGKSSAPLAFAVVLAVGLALLWRVVRTGARRARAVYATAAMFALIHSAWPTPIPLFALGLVLGWLAVRTNGILVPVVVHGLFNAVSAVYILRG